EDDRALDLSLDGVWIDDGAAIDRTDDAPYPHRSVLRHLNLGNVSHIGREHELKGNATAGSFRQRLSPAGLFGGECKDSFRAWWLIKEGESIRHGVLLCGRRELVHKAFDDKNGMRWPDAAPEGGRNARRLHLFILDAHVRETIDQIDRALRGV